MKRSTVLITGAAAVLGVAATVAATVGLGASGGTSETPVERPVTTVEITQRTLVESVTVSGELGYGVAKPFITKATGTVTWLPAEGTVIKRGDVVLRADNVPVVLLYGRVPMFRALTLNATGPDVKQLEQSLRALGYTGFTVDDTLSAATVVAVRQWQRSLGVPVTGEVGPGQVVFAPGPVRVDHLLLPLGAAANGPVFTATGTTTVVTVRPNGEDISWAVTGAPVSVTAPGGAVANGTVASVDGTSDPPESGSPEGESGPVVTIRIEDPKALGRQPAGIVDVRYVAQERPDVLTVPVAALLALAEGGYGLEIVDGSGTRIVAVHTGLFAEGLVEVRGPGIEAGMTVVMPG